MGPWAHSMHTDCGLRTDRGFKKDLFIGPAFYKAGFANPVFCSTEHIFIEPNFTEPKLSGSTCIGPILIGQFLRADFGT